MSVARCLLAATIGLLLAPAAPLGQAPADQAPTPPQLPTFRAEGRAIEVDVHVTDSQGRFVRGLTRDDFELLEDGQPQDISTFTLVDVPIERAETGANRRKKAAPLSSPDVTTNAVDGRIYVMLLDSPGLRPSSRAQVQIEEMFRFTRRVATQFVDDALGPKDLMAVMHVQGNRSDAQSFTSDKGLLRAAIERLKPDHDTWELGQYCDVQKIRNSYETLEAVSERLGATTGRRKAILWVNGQVPFDASGPDECNLPAGAALQFMQRDAIRAATRNNVAIYPIDSVGLTADPRVFPVDSDGTRTPGIETPEPPSRRLKRLAVLRAIAEDTGGDAIINTNNFSGGFERVVQLHSTYYLLGYRPPKDHGDGEFHSITVRVRRPNLSIRWRKGYRAPEPGNALEERLPGVSVAASEALVRSLPSNGLAMRAFLAPFRGAAGEGSVLLGAEVNGLARANAGGPTARLEISYLAVDSQGRPRVAPPKSLVLNMTESTDEAGVRYYDRLRLPPGRHEVRIAMHQDGGETGSIVSHVEVPDFARMPITMSGVVLVASAVTTPALLGDATLKGTPAADSTTRRRFSRRDTITALAEVYFEARIRVEDVAVTATILNTQGPKVPTKIPTRHAADQGRIGCTAALPLADLAPGDYLLTIEARAGRRSVSRQIPLSVGE